MKKIVFVLLALLSLAIFASCSEPYHRAPSNYDSDNNQDYVYHRVKYSGETLRLISSWYTKSDKNVNALLSANPEINPKRLKIGDMIKIPKRLLLREQSMPKDFVDGGSPRKSGSSKSAATAGMPSDTGTSTIDNSAGAETNGYEPPPAAENSYAPPAADNTYVPHAADNSGTVSSESAPPEAYAPPVVHEKPEAASSSSAAANPLRDQLMKELLDGK